MEKKIKIRENLKLTYTFRRARNTRQYKVKYGYLVHKLAWILLFGVGQHRDKGALRRRNG